MLKLSHIGKFSYWEVSECFALLVDLPLYTNSRVQNF